MTAIQDDLFPEANPTHHGEARNHRNLFLPKYLERDSIDYRLTDKAFDHASQIIRRWADLESSRRLLRRKETALQGEFLSEVFGAALGYVLFSEGIDEWNLDPAYQVNGGTVDAALGLFRNGQKTPLAIVELKGPRVNVDRDRFNGRTPVQQCWDYLNALPECPWGIVCNYVSFRLYHRDHTPRAYQLFVLQDLRRPEVFRQFYYVFERRGLIPTVEGQKSRAAVLLENTDNRQRKVGKELYEHYHENRCKLIRHLISKAHRKPLDKAIEISQKILDRIIFIAFCEDRGLLPEQSLHHAQSKIPPFVRVVNPRWRNFLDLFRSIDKGNENIGIPPYNGGLFREDEEVDNLQLDDDWTRFFESVGNYDFRDEVNVDVLGHIFERSVNDIERIRLGGFFDTEVEEGPGPKMAKSAERKRFGIYYTPRDFTDFIVHNVVGKEIDERFTALAQKHKLRGGDLTSADPDPPLGEYWRACLAALRDIRIVDPACGSGAFLIKAYDLLEERYHEVIDHIVFHDGQEAEALREQIPDIILQDNLFGVDVSPEAVEITQLALWIRSARPGKTLTDLSDHIVCGNSLVFDPNVHPRAMEWQAIFPAIFKREPPGFDCVIGNPPWERMKLQEREFFDARAPELAAAVNAATRRKIIAGLKKANPQLHERYCEAKAQAERTLDYARQSGRFPLTAKGDVNTYAVFAELARTIVRETGRVGLLVPSGIATDQTTSEFFRELVDSKALIGLYDFENRRGLFPDLHRSFKFSVLLFGGSKRCTPAADFVFFAHEVSELRDRSRHIPLSAEDIQLLNPNSRTCPVFRSQRDAELTKAVYRRVPILVNAARGEAGNPWGIRFLRMFDQTNDAELFRMAEQLKAKRFKRVGACWKKGKKTFLPLYEAKMIQMYDHRAASVVMKDENWMRQGQTAATTPVQHQEAEYFPEPRWWVEENHVVERLSEQKHSAEIAFKDVTSPTNTRTMIAAFIPFAGALNSAPLMLTGEEISERQKCCLLANFNSFAFDFVARQKVGGIHLNFFIVEQLPVFPPDFYEAACLWDRRCTLEKWVSDRVLKLTCTSNDMRPLAKAARFDPPVHKWKPDERAELQAELDAAYFVLYGIPRDDVEYILTTFRGAGSPPESTLIPVSIADLILQHYDRLQGKCLERS